MALKDSKAYHIENLIEIEPDAQVVLLSDAEELERENTAYSITVANLEKQLEEAKAENEKLKFDRGRARQVLGYINGHGWTYFKMQRAAGDLIKELKL